MMMRFAGVCIALGACAVIGSNAWVYSMSHHRVVPVFSREDTHQASVAIILGAQLRHDGTLTDWLRYRMDTGIDLYRAGRVDALVLTGNDEAPWGAEVQAMHAYALSQGVDESVLIDDNQAIDTHTSCVRAHDVLGIDEALVVTQDYHAPRAVALCRSAGIDAYGVTDTRPHTTPSRWVNAWLRERVAAVKAVADCVVDWAQN
ncbi:SanA/YdcF family protein [Actinomyces vulturis]|uniref:SanA/YdcF family protein n=1 Tax=Actinomyces vulturis TaxID=1857645 RepID=UPI000829B7D9|nr:YdcF family protein [Actinomyces vulturis]